MSFDVAAVRAHFPALRGGAAHFDGPGGSQVPDVVGQDVAAVSALAHGAGALTYVDGVHLTAHSLVDVAALGADFFSCSPYKFLGPHLGVVAAAPALLETLRPDRLLPMPDSVPERFELGTLPY